MEMKRKILISIQSEPTSWFQPISPTAYKLEQKDHSNNKSTCRAEENNKVSDKSNLKTGRL